MGIRADIIELLGSLTDYEVRFGLFKLSKPQTKVFATKIVPDVDISQRKVVVNQLIKNQKNEATTPSTSRHLAPKTTTNETLYQCFILMIDGLLAIHSTILSTSKCLKKLDENELYVLEQFLIAQASHPSLLEKISEELTLRQEDNPQDKQHEEYRKYWRENRDNHQWETQHWKKIIAHVNETIEENKIIAKEDNQTATKSQSWYTFMWISILYVYNGIKSLFNSLYNLVTTGSFISAKVPSQLSDSNKLESNSSESSQIEALRKAGAECIQRESGLSQQHKDDKNFEYKEKAMMSRYGYSINAQMIAGMANKQHAESMEIFSSLALPTDTENEISIIKTIVNNCDDLSTINSQHSFAKPGYANIVTMHEQEMFKTIVDPNLDWAQYGFSFTKAELERLNKFNSQFQKSKDINNAQLAACQDWGGYEAKESGMVGVKTYTKIENESEFDEKQQKLESNILSVSKGILEKCSSLQDNEALYLETGLEYHAMKLSIKKIGNEFKLTCYDSAGALENSNKSNTLIGMISLALMGYNCKRKNAFSFSIPSEKLLSNDGLEYMKNLVKINSLGGQAEESLKNNFYHSTRESRAKLGWLGEKLALRKQLRIYQNYMDKFTAIADENAPAKFEDILQYPQNTDNCFAKKSQVCQLYEFGKDLYDKFRAATLIMQKEYLIREYCNESEKSNTKGKIEIIAIEYQTMLKNIPVEMLSPDELYKASMRLSEIKTIPSTAYYKEYFQELIALRNTLTKQSDKDSKLILNRINAKLNTYAMEYYEYLEKGNRSKEIQELYQTSFIESTNKEAWIANNIPFQEEKNGELLSEKAFEKLSEFAAASACKASIQLINHQIKKKTVKQRVLNENESRLKPLGLFESTKNILEASLEEANIVRFYSGLARIENIKVEMEINGIRKEISVENYFHMVKDNKQALKNPKIIELLNYLRNISPEYEKSYIKNVYPTHKEFLSENIKHKCYELNDKLNRTKDKLKSYKSKVQNIKSGLEFKIKQLEEERDRIKQHIGSDRNSTILHNIELKLIFLKKEHDSLQALITHISVDYDSLNTDVNVSGSPYNIINGGLVAVESMNEHAKSDKEIKTIIRMFLQTNDSLSNLNENLSKTLSRYKDTTLPEIINKTSLDFNRHRINTIKSSLSEIPEYNIIRQLSLNELGTYKYNETKKNSAFFNSESSPTLNTDLFKEIKQENHEIKIKIRSKLEHGLIVSQTEALSNQINIFDQLIKSDNDTQEIDEYLSKYTSKTFSEDIKKEWVIKMLKIWGKYQDIPSLFKVNSDPRDAFTETINKHFHIFIEDKLDININVLRNVDFPVEITQEDIISAGISIPTKKQLNNAKIQKKHAVEALSEVRQKHQRKKSSKNIKQAQEKLIQPLSIGDFPKIETKDPSSADIRFVPPEYIELSQGVDKNYGTPIFLKNNPPPKITAQNTKEYENYLNEIKEYYNLLFTHKSLENKQQRLLDFLIKTCDHLFEQPYELPKYVRQDLSDLILSHYQDEHQGIEKAFVHLENTQRSIILTALLKLYLSSLPNEESVNISPKTYSLIRQWQRLIVPSNALLNDKIQCLVPNSEVKEESVILNKVDIALHHSPTGLECINEGQQGLQLALTTYGNEKEIDKNLRNMADRLYMRNGQHLLAKQFLDYYSEYELLYSKQGISSTQGREFFKRAFINAFQSATTHEKALLIQKLDGILIKSTCSDSISANLSIPHNVFIENLLLQCQSNDSSLDQHLNNSDWDTHDTDDFIDEMTTGYEAERRLLGFAMDINTSFLRLNAISNEDPEQAEKTQNLVSKIILSNLALQRLLENLSEEQINNINDNFEYHCELAKAKMNILENTKLLREFSSHIQHRDKAASFLEVFKSYQAKDAFDGIPVKISHILKSDIPGFIELGNNKRLDIIHGVVYIGNVKEGQLPEHIQSHLTLQELNMELLPFTPSKIGYVYTEDGLIKAAIQSNQDGSLLIQRELKVLSTSNKMLQYIDPKEVSFLPELLKHHIDAEHFFVDSEATIHGFNKHFQAILELTINGNEYEGYILDHNNQIVTITSDKAAQKSMAFNELITIIPPADLVTISQTMFYIPSIKQYIHVNDGEYILQDKIESALKQQKLTILDNGLARTDNILHPDEIKTLQKFNDEIEQCKSELELCGNDILGKNKSEKIRIKIGSLHKKINDLYNPKVFIYKSENTLINNKLDEVRSLRSDLTDSYSKYQSKKSKNSQLQYQNLTKSYHNAKTELNQLRLENQNLLTYNIASDNALIANDLQSILKTKELEKTFLLIEQLKTFKVQKPLSSLEIMEITTIRNNLSSKSEQDTTIVTLLIDSILQQHHILERKAFLNGRIPEWHKEDYEKISKRFHSKITKSSARNQQDIKEALKPHWEQLQFEFSEQDEIHTIMQTDIITHIPVNLKPAYLNSNPRKLPIEIIHGANDISYLPHENIENAMDREQVFLLNRLNDFMNNGLLDHRENIEAQENGYFYENYGLFDLQTLRTLFKVDRNKDEIGVNGINMAEVNGIFDLLYENKWIEPVVINGITRYHLTTHPYEIFNAYEITSKLTSLGLSEQSAKLTSERLESFLYNTANLSGKYSIPNQKKDILLNKLEDTKANYLIESLQAQDVIDSIIQKSTRNISYADLKSAYLLNDYHGFLNAIPANERDESIRVLSNALTRKLYFTTELDHLNDISSNFARNKDEKAITLLLSKRNYSLDRIIKTTKEDAGLYHHAKEDPTAKMQRAFLLFESSFKHRCNARQVDVFKGLLLDDELDVEKIDSAQATMGFGKTSLLPLIALYKTGQKLVRFVVPKSALETNAADMTSTLQETIGSRVIIDDFRRYRIPNDDEAELGDSSPKLIALRDAKADLNKRLALYKNAINTNKVLIQAPNVRNSIECQAKLFLNMLLSMENEPLQAQELMACISIINEIRSLKSISIFDELDATQDKTTTDVNYTLGEKISFDEEEILPLEKICHAVLKGNGNTIRELAIKLLKQFDLPTAEDVIAYIINTDVAEPSSLSMLNSKPVYLIRAVLNDPNMMGLITKKEAGTDYGVWFDTSKNGSKIYDHQKFKSSGENQEQPLLISVPYSAANTPKPMGSRFDNPEVTAITTILFYQDPRTEIQEDPHLQFVIDSFRNGQGSMAFNDINFEVEQSLSALFDNIKFISEIEDPIIRNQAQKAFYNDHMQASANSALLKAFRTILSRCIILEQVTFDAGKASSNRYEQGSASDTVIGFSGTTGDTSSYFKTNKVDAAADGNMTLGIMGRHNCQQTIDIDPSKLVSEGSQFTASLVKELSKSFTKNTRTFIDVGGLCKTTNLDVAKSIALQLKTNPSFKNNKGIIFYDDITNTKNVLSIDKKGNFQVNHLTDSQEEESNSKGNYFTYYDQAHSRGADIKQMDNAHAVLTFNHCVTNNDYKQAIMRMRKIINKNPEGQSFSVAVPIELKKQILDDLGHEINETLSGNDIAFWLRKQELTHQEDQSILMMMEYDAIIKNAMLQQQAQLTNSINCHEMSVDQIETFKRCIRKLNEIQPLIDTTCSDLRSKYGKVTGIIEKDNFLDNINTKFEQQLGLVFDSVSEAKVELDLPPLQEEDKSPYLSMRQQVIDKRESTLQDELSLSVFSSNISEVHSEQEAQSQTQTQSQAQAQTHTFSEVNNEEVIVDVVLKKQSIEKAPINIEYLSDNELLSELSHAFEIDTLSNIFKYNSQVKCSPLYTIPSSASNEDGSIIPPVRYFVARESGDPLIILINQDEADLFMKDNLTQWSLYQLDKENSLEPIAGPPINAIEGTLSKLLSFASYHHQISGDNLKDIGRSLNGICLSSDLYPTLEMNTDNPKHDNSIISFPEWGFYGERQQSLPMTISQVNEQVAINHYKRGINIHLGNNEEQPLFVSSVLNERILSCANDEIKVPGKPVLSLVKEDIDKEYQAAYKKKNEIHEELKKLKQEHKATIEHYDKEITELQSLKEQKLAEAKQKVSSEFESILKDTLYIKKNYFQMLSPDIYNSCTRLNKDERVLRIKNIFQDTKDSPNSPKFLTFQDIKHVAQYFTADYFENVKPAEPKDSNRQLQKIINKTIEKVTEIYRTNATIATNKACSIATAVYNSATSHTGNNNLKVGKTSLHDYIKNHFKCLQGKLSKTQIEDLCQCVCGAAISVSHSQQKNPQDIFDPQVNFELSSLFFKTLQSNLNDFQTIYKNDLQEHFNDNFLEIIQTFIFYNLLETDAELKTVITDLVTSKFFEQLNTPPEALSEVCENLKETLSKQQSQWEYDLPDLFNELNHEFDIDEVREVVLDELRASDIEAFELEELTLSRRCMHHLKARQKIMALLNKFTPIENRSPNLELDNKGSYDLSKNLHGSLADLDHSLKDIDKQLSDAKKNRQTDLDDINVKISGKRVDARNNKEIIKKLKLEKSAVNKILAGLKRFFKIFESINVMLERSNPFLFLQDNVNLPMVINDNMEVDAELCFSPPEFYKVDEDMTKQKSYMHGLHDNESIAQHGLANAVDICKTQAAEIQSRDYKLNETLYKQAPTQCESPVSAMEIGSTMFSSTEPKPQNKTEEPPLPSPINSDNTPKPLKD